MILDKADKVVWCGHRGMFVPFTSPHKTCSQKLHEFCTPKKECDPVKRKLKNKGNKKHKCWKEFVLGENLPSGLPIEDSLYICQKFAAGTDYAGVYGERANYLTLYDRQEKTPFISFGKFSEVGQTTWPAVPHMVEKALVKKDQGIMKWFTTRKKMSGMTYENTMDKAFEDVCKLGAYQALLNDYIDVPYEITPLLAPSLVGGNVGRQIAALAMTNTVPMHVSIYTSWQKLDSQVRSYAIQKCGVPSKESKGQKSPNRKPHNYPEMYIMAGRVPSTNITIGNNVNVPYLIWMAGCCVRGAEASSFAAYVRNVKNGPIVKSPIEQLEILLSDLHNTTDNVHLFPAYNKICSNIQNDVSNYLKI
ncbi:hypothetical protein FSP39_014531 [Pinctada imbricata]|uniref:Uncharacterized protein n=1 Tax=Pinctada imbricata TaxID=66713 RepID=A0AA88YK70_PINIB|nr:hypothetical protein FSP39_014531 [Pinctada imbricata]